MIDKLLESLDGDIFSTELKESMLNEFNDALVLAESRIREEITSEYDNKFNEMMNEAFNEMVEVYDEKMEVAVNEMKEELIEEYEGKFNEMSETVQGQLDSFLDSVIDGFVEDVTSKLQESLNAEKADMIIEAVESMIVATGVDIAKIAESKNETSSEYKIQESKAAYNKLMQEHIELKNEKNEILKQAIIMEMKEDLTLVESQKFENLAKMVEFREDGSFIKKLETIKESISKKVQKEVTESVPQKLEESKIPSIASYKHLV